MGFVCEWKSLLWVEIENKYCKMLFFFLWILIHILKLLFEVSRVSSLVNGQFSEAYQGPTDAILTRKYILCLNLYKIHWYNDIGKKSYFWPLVVIKYILNMNNISLGKTAPLLLVMGSHSQNPKTTKTEMFGATSDDVRVLQRVLQKW